MDRFKPRVAIVVLCVAAAGFTLGTLGYHERGSRLVPLGWEDAAFRSVQLLFLGYDTGADPPVFELRLARWMLAGVALVLVGVLVFVVVAGRLMRRRIASWQLRNHVIVVAEGAWLERIVASLRDGDDGIHEDVAIAILTRDEEAGALIEGSYQGVSIWPGSADDPAIVRWLKLDKAVHAIVAMDDDPASIRAALSLRVATGGVRRLVPLGIVCLIRSIPVARALAVEGVSRTDSSVALEFLAPLEVGAALAIRDMGYAEAWRTKSMPKRLILVGTNDLGEEILLRLAAAWRSSRCNDERLALDLVGDAAQTFLQSLSDRHPGLASLVEGKAHGRHALASLIARSDAHVLVAGGDDPRALATAIEAAGASSEDQQVELFVTGRTLEFDLTDGPAEGSLGGLGIQAVERYAFDPNVLRNSRRETLARRLDEEFSKKNRPNGGLVPWGASDYDRQSSRAAADRIVQTLLTLGFLVVPDPLVTIDDDLPIIEGAALEKGARMEHKKWETFLKEQGWQYGETSDNRKDLARKVHPQLKPYDDLSEENREKDRDNVRLGPRLLAEVGLRVLETTRSSEHSDG